MLRFGLVVWWQNHGGHFFMIYDSKDESTGILSMYARRSQVVVYMDAYLHSLDLGDEDHHHHHHAPTLSIMLSSTIMRYACS